MNVTSMGTSRTLLAVAALAIASTAPLTASNVEVRHQPLGWIKPGTVVEKKAPNGWTHLVYVSRPRVGAGDVDEVSQTVKDHARYFTVAVTANVVKSADGAHQIDRVGLGIGTSIGRKNTIVTSETQKALGANLGFIARQILSQSEKNFQTGNTQIARTSTMVVFDSKVMLLVKDEHREMISRNVLLLSRESGALGLLRWMFDVSPNGRYLLVDEPMQYFRPGFQEDQVLNVKADEFFLGIPGKKALAQVKMHEGVPVNFTPQLKSLAARQRYSAEQAVQLENELWKLWSTPTAAVRR